MEQRREVLKLAGVPARAHLGVLTSKGTSVAKLPAPLKKDITRIAKEFSSWSSVGLKFAHKVNPNRPAQYQWLSKVLSAIVTNGAHQLGAKNEQGQRAVPLFAIAGACPSKGLMSTPMQAVLYFLCDKTVRFWWVKPVAGKPDQMGSKYLTATAKGKYKNLPGQLAKGVYGPLAKLFERGKPKGGIKFGLERLASGATRAVITKGKVQMWVYLVWQEEWDSSIISFDNFLRGKLVYQHSVSEECFYVRQFVIRGDSLSMLDNEEGPFGPGVIPSDIVKQVDTRAGRSK